MRLALFILSCALAGCTAGGSAFYDAARLDDPDLGLCTWSGRFKPPIVYRESDHIRGYFEAADLDAYRLAIPRPFTMPQRALLRISVLDFYDMENGPAYLESEVSVLVLHQGRPGWFVLTMPVTDRDACSGGRNALGTPKVMRRITLERGAARYVGTSYARGGREAEMVLTLDVGEAGEAARDVLRFVSAFPDFTLLNGRVLEMGGGRQPVYELERAAPGIWKVQLGAPRVDFPRDPQNLLRRLGIGEPVGGYWGQVRSRFIITPREAGATPAR